MSLAMPEIPPKANEALGKFLDQTFKSSASVALYRRLSSLEYNDFAGKPTFDGKPTKEEYINQPTNYRIFLNGMGVADSLGWELMAFMDEVDKYVKEGFSKIEVINHFPRMIEKLINYYEGDLQETQKEIRKLAQGDETEADLRGSMEDFARGNIRARVQIAVLKEIRADYEIFKGQLGKKRG